MYKLSYNLKQTRPPRGFAPVFFSLVAPLHVTVLTVVLRQTATLAFHTPKFEKCILPTFLKRFMSENWQHNHLSSQSGMKSQILHTVWCNISGEAAGEIWNLSLLAERVNMCGGGSAPSEPSVFQGQCLDAHNAYRAQYGAPALTWDGNLASKAADRASEIASTGSSTATNKGENLGSATGSVLCAEMSDPESCCCAANEPAVRIGKHFYSLDCAR